MQDSICIVSFLHVYRGLPGYKQITEVLCFSAFPIAGTVHELSLEHMLFLFHEGSFSLFIVLRGLNCTVLMPPVWHLTSGCSRVHNFFLILRQIFRTLIL